MERVLEFLREPFLGNPLWLWAAALGVTAVVFAVLLVVRKFVTSRFESLAKRTDNRIDDLIAGVVKRTGWFFLLAMGVLAGSLVLGEEVMYLRQGLVVVALVQAGLWAMALLAGFLDYWKSQRPDASASVGVVAMGFLGKLLIWSMVLLLTLDNLGVDVTALITGMGIGGIAVALAAQNILGDLFAAISIIIDRPFEVGDFIIVGDLMGSVEHIGLKTTRVRSLSGEQLVFGNSDLLASRIRNFKRMRERRAVFGFGVVYQTSADQVEKIPAWVREIIEARELARLDRAHFKSFGASSLDFEVVYYVSVPDYNTFMDIQQAINLALVRKFEAEGIEFAYPTQTLHVEHQAKD